MALMDLPVGTRLDCLQDLLSYSGSLHRWSYDAAGSLVWTDCPDTVLDAVFSSVGCMDAVLEHAKGQRGPMVLGNPYGLSWCAAFEFDADALQGFYVLGPIQTTDVSPENIAHAIRRAKIPREQQAELIKTMRRLPTMYNIDFFRSALMLHFCVTGEWLTSSDITFCEPALQQDRTGEAPRKDRTKTYQTERALMRMVTEGDTDYKSVLMDATLASRGVQISSMGSLTQAQVSQIVFISLCTRAAIEGGITPEMAYSRGDAYIQDILECKSSTDATRIGHAMYDDFIHLVHNRRFNGAFSPPIQSCCDYIELHVEEKLTLGDIARRIGYADYYLSRKFKEETGVSINDFIKMAKVSKAKTLLLASDLDIQTICDRLNFGSRSFFAETFKKIEGIPPAAYRNQNRRE